MVAVRQSLGYFPLIGEHSFTLNHYGVLFHDIEFRKSLVLTFLLASMSTLISSVAGLALALALRDIARHSRLLNTLLQVPIGVPHLVMAVAVLISLLPVVSLRGLFTRPDSSKPHWISPCSCKTGTALASFSLMFLRRRRSLP